MGTKLEKFGQLLEKLGLTVVAVLAGAIAFFLSVVSMLHTTAVDKIDAGQGLYTIVYDIKEKLESVYYLNDNLFLNLLVLGCCLMLMFYLIQWKRPVKLRRLALFIFLWTFVLGTIWVVGSQSAPSEDSGTVTSASWAFAENNYSVLADNRYFHNYSFQLGYVFFNECIIRLFQTFRHLDNLMPLEVLNAAFLGVINLFLLLINDKLFKDSRINLVTTVLLASSAAPIISCSFVYGIYPGMMFAVIALYCELRYLIDNKLIFSWLSAFSLMLAVMTKSNYLIWMIAILLIAFCKMWKRRKFLQDCSYMILILALCMTIQPLVIRHYEKVSGTEIGDAIPYVSWIDMGLNESDLAPGWYNYWITVSNFEQCDFNAEAAAERSKENIKNRLKYFAEHPQYTNDFFYLKIVSQWNDTAYQSLWNNVVRFQYREKSPFAAWVCGDGAPAVKHYMDYIAQLVFFAFCAGCWFLYRRKTFILTPIPIIFLGGFFYQLISEGKSQYIMPYFIVMTAFSAFGIVCLCDAFCRRISPESKIGRLMGIGKKAVPAAQTDAPAETAEPAADAAASGAPEDHAEAANKTETPETPAEDSAQTSQNESIKENKT
ncbi:MAG: hypothetical protein IKQ91_07960 [Oscillospiraceae bacterium]|nr:hypothetical protein [Oscillospiraceae bacterium]